MYTLTKQDNEICKGDTCKINEDESAAALKETNNNKSPGSDGLTTEYFSKYFGMISNCFL